jgi:hypothetical protein
LRGDVFGSAMRATSIQQSGTATTTWRDRSRWLQELDRPSTSAASRGSDPRRSARDTRRFQLMPGLRGRSEHTSTLSMPSSVPR